MDFKQTIKAYLDKMAQQDFAFAERYKSEKKSLDQCCKYIMSEAKKQAKNGCAAVEDSIVYGWAVHYYQEDDVVIEKTNIHQVVTPKAYKPKVEKPKEIKPIKALVKDKSDKEKCVQLDLFADFGL
jgi:hypothetical protein